MAPADPPPHPPDEPASGARRAFACRFCGLPLAGVVSPTDHRPACPRCGNTLWTARSSTVSRSLALSITGLILFFPALTHPIFTFEVVGRKNDNLMMTGVIDLWIGGEAPIAAIVLFTSIVAPLLRFFAVFLQTLPMALGRPLKSSLRLNATIEKLNEWAMLDVYLLAIAVTYAKLSHFGSMSFGVGWPALLGIILTSIALTRCYSAHSVEQLLTPGVVPRPAPPSPRSLGRCEALLLTGAILVVPAYTSTILIVVEYGHVKHDTVYGAVQELTGGGQYLLGGLMFVASIVVPITKLIVLSLLTLSIRLGLRSYGFSRTRVFLFIERIGRWSFVDFFVISMMVALAKLGVFATATAEAGLLIFAGVVLSTMFAATSLDPRLFWNPDGRHADAAPRPQGGRDGIE